MCWAVPATPPSEKLNIAGIGMGGMGSRRRHERGRARTSWPSATSTSNALASNAKLYPKAKLHADYRKMLETQKDIDAVVIATPTTCTPSSR